jgi:hypothetical protein
LCNRNSSLPCPRNLPGSRPSRSMKLRQIAHRLEPAGTHSVDGYCAFDSQLQRVYAPDPATCRATCAASRSNSIPRKATPIWSATTSGLLHPGRHQVPRPHSLGQDGDRPRLSASGVRTRYVLGSRIADAGEHAYAGLGDVGPPADDGVVALEGREGVAGFIATARQQRIWEREPTLRSPG